MGSSDLESYVGVNIAQNMVLLRVLSFVLWVRYEWGRLVLCVLYESG